MSTKQFRAAVTAEVVAWAAANFPAIPVIYENGPVPDEDKIGNIFIDLELRFYSATTKTLGEGGMGRHSGAIALSVFYREAAGTGLVDDVVDSAKGTMRLRRIGGGIVKFPQRTVPTNIKGWYKSGLLFPFTLDE